MSGNKGQELGAEPDEALEARVAALVNPASGLANDFLNVYNEILMLIEMLPGMPELADDILGWRPCSYRAYFMQCNLPGRAEALEAYGRLDPAFRTLFETSVELLAECGLQAIRAIEKAMSVGAAGDVEHLANVCVDWCGHLRTQLDATEQLINWGHVGRRRSRQSMIDSLFSAA